MTAQPIYIVDMFAELVGKIESALLPQLQAYDANIKGVFYEFGHPIEILETLKQKDESQSFRFKKYPLIALFQDFDERMGQQLGIYAKTSFRLAICHHTSPELKSKERYEQVFKPVLYPIYLKLMEQIKLSANFLYEGDEIRHTKTDHVFYGRSLENPGNDFLDAIEITDLELSIYQKNC